MAKKTVQQKILAINLLHPQGFPEKLPIKFLKWLLNYGRYIVILVEIIVLAAFVYRFKLDADLAYIKEKIDNNLPYIQSLSQDEALIKQTQQRLSVIKTTYAKNITIEKVTDKITQLIPDTTHLSSLSLNLAESPVQIKITAQTTTNNDISTFLNNLKLEKDLFQNIQMTGISFDQGNITFIISGEVK
jgi:hypothetical protein